MFLHTPLVVALAVITFFLYRKGSLKPVHALACAALGFYLADTTLAGSIHSASANLVGMIGQFGV